MAENTSSNQHSSNNPTKEKIWYDPEEYAIRKRLPPTLPRRPIDIYITNKTAFKAQIERCQSLLDKGEPEIYLHSLGAAIPRALNLALQIQKNNCNTFGLDTATSTVELTDDFEAIHPNSESSGQQHHHHHQQQSRYNSAVHIRIYYNPKPVEVVTDGQEQ